MPPPSTPPELWKFLLTPVIDGDAVAAWCVAHGAMVEWPPHLRSGLVKKGMRDTWLARHLIKHLLDGLSVAERRELRVDGQSLVRYALDRNVRWALAELLIRQAGPAEDDSRFVFDLLRRQPQRWKTFQARADLTTVARLRDTEGQSPLQFLAASGNAHGVAGLLAAGADPRASDAWARTPLHALWGACDPPPHSGHAAASALLDAAGADWDARDARGRTPFHLLLRHGAGAWRVDDPLPMGSVNDVDEEGVRPLGRVLRRHTEVIAHLQQGRVFASWLMQLLARGADWDAPNGDGTTPRQDLDAWWRAASACKSGPSEETHAFLRAVMLDSELAGVPASGAARRRL